MDKNEEIELQAAVFQRLVDHLRKETELQNIDLMNLAGFCRNCLGKWYLEAAEEQGLDIDYDTAREKVYGMKYEEWKREILDEATKRVEQLDQMHQKKRS